MSKFFKCRMKECDNPAEVLLRGKPVGLTGKDIGSTKHLFGICKDCAYRNTSKGEIFVNWAFPEKSYRRECFDGPVSKNRGKEIRKKFDWQDKKEKKEKLLKV